MPSETSVFDTRTMPEIYAEIREIYLRYPQPWVIGYSGGKDSTTVLQLIWNALLGLPEVDRQKPVFVIASDTGVETPVIIDHIDRTLTRINRRAQEDNLPFRAQKVAPTLNDSYWVNLIGRGYPAPTNRFRWCTERLKIKPINHFIQDKITEYGEAIVVLGTRKAESATRMQLMNSYQVAGHVLRRHTSLPGAYVYAPIADFCTADVWSYLLQVRPPWGGSNRRLATLYHNANKGECPLVVDLSTPPCGNSRFGCWVCTLVKKDSSMESMIDKGDEWMEPLLQFRNWLMITTDPEKKREFRDIRGRDGRVIWKKDGTLAARTYKFEVSQSMLETVLQSQEEIRRTGPNPNIQLITEEELLEIRRIWRTERQDWEDSLPAVFLRVTGRKFDCAADDNVSFDSDQKALLSAACAEYGVPFELVARLLEAERRSSGMARRARIFKELAAELGRDWRTEDEMLAEQPSPPGLV